MKKFTSSSLALLALLFSAAALAQPALPSLPSLPSNPPGLYVVVLDGLIKVTNPVGTSNFSAGQFGFTASSSVPPVILPKAPVLQFTLPVAFNSSRPNPGTTNNPRPGGVDCEVR